MQACMPSISLQMTAVAILLIRDHLLQEVLMTMNSWVTSLSYAAADTVSDNCGQLFATDDTGLLAGAQPVVKDIRQAWLPASLISWVTKAPSRPCSSQGIPHAGGA